MKRNSFLIRTWCAFLCTIFCTFMIVSSFSCSSFLSDVKEEDEKMHKEPEPAPEPEPEPEPEEPEKQPLSLSNFKFDSLGLVISADTEAKDGTEISVICNEKNNTAKACGGKISWNVSLTSLPDGLPLTKSLCKTGRRRLLVKNSMLVKRPKRYESRMG